MVNKLIISKSIDDAIIKCSQGFRLNKKVLKTFNKFHDETCGEKFRKTEKAIVTDNMGNIVYQKNGGKHSVNIDEKKTGVAFEEYGELHITHNHPRRLVAESLSTNDIEKIYEEKYVDGEGFKFIYKSISCESPNGSRMTLVRGDDFTLSNVTYINSLAERLEDYSNKYESDFYKACLRLKEHYPFEDIVNDDMKHSNERYIKYVTYIKEQALKEVGVFEKNKEFKDIQKGFRDNNCKLTYTFPDDYNIKEIMF